METKATFVVFAVLTFWHSFLLQKDLIAVFTDFAIQATNTTTTSSSSSSTEETLGQNHTSFLAPPGKGKLIIHVGPPKTGTTTLQSELRSVLGELHSDGYEFFNGQLPDKNAGHLLDNCQRDLALARNRTNTTTSGVALYDTLVNVPCWKARLDELAKWRRAGKRNIILSNELLGFRWMGLMGVGRAPADWTSLKVTLEQEHYEIHVVVGYRRYFEWLASAKYHEDTWSPTRPRRNKWPNNGGRALQPIYPIMLEPKRQLERSLPFQYSDTLLEHLRAHFPDDRIHILDIHHQRGEESILTNFVCNIVGNAPNTCQRSRDKDKQAAREARTNVRKDGTIGEVFYDMLVTGAASKSLFPTTGLNRHASVLLAIQHHEKRMKEKNQTVTDLPKRCPSQNEVQSLFQMSLALEQEILPASSHNTTAFKQAFDKFVFGKKMLCTIDVDAALEEPTWKDYFASLNNRARDQH